MRGYLNPSRLGQFDPIDLLTPDGEHEEIPLANPLGLFRPGVLRRLRARAQNLPQPPQARRPWVRLRYLDGETLEGVVPNDLLGLLDNGVQITPPD